MIRRVVRKPSPSPSPTPASAICQVVTGDDAGCAGHICDCIHMIGEDTWYIGVDEFTGTAVTYCPDVDPISDSQLITLPELAELL